MVDVKQGNVGEDRINPGIRVLPLPNATGFFRVRETSCPYDGKLSLNEDEPKLANGMGKETGTLLFFFSPKKGRGIMVLTEEVTSYIKREEKK